MTAPSSALISVLGAPVDTTPCAGGSWRMGGVGWQSACAGRRHDPPVQSVAVSGPLGELGQAWSTAPMPALRQ